jgi:hypothetical protein
VSMTALSAVGAAFSAGADAVCAPATALKLKTAATAAIATSDLVIREPAFHDRVARPIAISFFPNA